ncbi:unnamed protein product [Mycena citricolor]|uniref:P-loop containing nucleoside triphosphate hydrolase protein n=1 Tax=Mycena citricolor TaxID=2018698 RepID=A0AAD2K050_9AGAR|nr:unnamed protein product [Mycena citricolor]
MSPLTHLYNFFRPPASAPLPPPAPQSHAPGALASLLGVGVGSSLKLLVLGSLVETGRRVFRWLIERFRIQYCTTLRFNAGDPAYEWVILFLTQENIWRRSRDFVVCAQNSRRKWSVPPQSSSATATAAATPESSSTSTPSALMPSHAHAEYVPTFSHPQLFRWRTHWVEVTRTGSASGSGSDSQAVYMGPTVMPAQSGQVLVTIYTLDMSVMAEFVEAARRRYVEVNKPHVVVHLTDSHYGPNHVWPTVKHKTRRSLDSVILPPGRLASLMEDVREFLSAETWYMDAGIPHRRGYLLYGPPGTGKTSTIYALAGALNLEIYSLSLASRFVDDSYLQRAASAIPKNGIFLIEDIDCAFPSREAEDEIEPAPGMRARNGMQNRSRPSVTLSGLLNVIDGVGSEEGKLFFATTNHIERLDAAFMRPGRIDVKIEYELATSEQAGALFLKFFPPAAFERELPGVVSRGPSSADQSEAEEDSDTEAGTSAVLVPRPLTMLTVSPELPSMVKLASEFSAEIPNGRFSTAELQGYLQGYRTRPADAVRGVAAWVEDLMRSRHEETEATRMRSN